MPWALQNSFPGSPQGNDGWVTYSLLPGANISAYGFRLVPPSSPYPPSWQIGGLWQFCQAVDNVVVLSSIQPFSLVTAGGVPNLTVIGPENVVEVAGNVSGNFVAISVNRWIPVRGVEIWALLG